MATCIWRGDGVALPQTISRTISGTWLSDEEITLTLNGKDVVIVVGDDTDPSEIAQLIAQAWNGETLTDSAATVSPLDGGGSIPEYAEVTAQVSGAVLTLIADTAGKPFTNPSLSTDSVDGNLGSWSTLQASAGPNHWDTAENWDGDALPANSDTAIIPAGSVSILYGLDQSSVTLAALQIEQGYTGVIGLPEINTDGGYDEYRDTYLKIGATALTIGNGTGQGSQRIKIDLGSVQSAVSVNNSGQPETDTHPAILLKGTHSSNVLNIVKGSVGVAVLPSETATIATLSIGYLSNPDNDSIVVLGSGVTLTTVNLSGGRLTVNSATTLITQTGGQLSVLSGAHAAINMDGGSCFYASAGTLSAVKVGNGATFDLSRDMRSKTISACEIYAGGRIHDPFKVATWSAGVDLVRTSIDRVTLNLGSHLTLTPSAI